MNEPEAVVRWRTSPSVAWSEGRGRIAVLDLTAGDGPRLCPEPAASLWRAAAQGAGTEYDLVGLASGLVGAAAAPGLVASFIEAFAEAGLLIEVDG